MPKFNGQKQIAILVPAHNEEVVLSQTLKSALSVVNNADLYVVDDGSSDNTFQIAKKLTKNVLRLKSGLGKANALNEAICHFKLPYKYKFIFPLDADTVVNPSFLEKSLKVLNDDKKEKYICVTGRVMGESNNWLTSYRMWEYEVTQLIHKTAQAKEQAIIVCPGCSTVYRSRLFSKIQIPSDTAVEDMDLTFLIHRENLGQIAYTTKASVTTQDPYSFKDYLKQIRRWYRGYWQCLKKYRIPWGRQTLDLELSMLTIEGLSGGLMMLFLLFTFPFIIHKQPSLLLIPFGLDFVLFFFPTVFLTMFVRSNLKFLKYLPTFYLIRAVNSLIFLYSFVESLFALNSFKWNQVTRYMVKEGKTCTAH